MRYLIDGCYGDGNVGDECLLEAMTRLIRRNDPEAEVRAMSADAAQTEREHGLPAIAQCNPFGWNIYGSLLKGLLWRTVREIRACDVFVIGGGELYRDRAGLSATLGMFYRARIARWLGKPVVAIGVGAQTPTTPWGPAVLRRALRDASALLFRDPVGLEAARQLAGDLPRAAWAPDPVFSLDWKLPGHDRAKPMDIVEIGVAVKSLPKSHAQYEAVHERFPQVLADALGILAASRSVRVTLLPFSREDHAFARSLCSSLDAYQPQICEPNKDALKRTMSGLDALIALPLHASVFAFSLGLPAVGVAYDLKVTRLYGNFGVSENCLPVAGIDARQLADRVAHLLADREAIGRALRDQAAAASERFSAAASGLLEEVCRDAVQATRRSVPLMPPTPANLES